MTKINILGDSITFGLYAEPLENSFVNLLAKSFNAEIRNYGVCGMRMTLRPKEYADAPHDFFCFKNKVDEMNHDANLMLVFGGTNDYGPTNCPLGKLGDDTVHTVYGGIECLIKELLKHYKKEQITFISPLYREDENMEAGSGSSYRGPLSKIRIAIQEECKKYNIYYLDIKDKIGKAEGNPLFEDGLHPNNEGHALIAKTLEEFLFKKR